VGSKLRSESPGHPRISRRGLTADSSPSAETITANRLVQIADLGVGLYSYVCRLFDQA